MSGRGPCLVRKGAVASAVALITLAHGVIVSGGTGDLAAGSRATIASDPFARVVAGGWGTAPVGGTYAVPGAASEYRVDGSSAAVSFAAAGKRREGELPDASARDVDIIFRVAVDKVPTGGSMHVWAAVRRLSAATSYRLDIRFSSDGSVFVSASGLVSGVVRPIGSAVKVPGRSQGDASFVWVHGRVRGTSPARIRLRAWAQGDTEPTDWQYSATDSTRALRHAGGLALGGYLGARVTNPPVTLRFDDLTATDLSGPEAVLAGAGDIASCSGNGDEATADLLDGIEGTVFAAGDTVYEDGTAAEFAECYEPSWGRFKERTRPAIGNHEYGTPGASGYFDYFGDAAGPDRAGYYAFDHGLWRIYVLNSMCDRVACDAGSAQERWLRTDLSVNPRRCAAAIWHHPRFSSSGSNAAVRPLWQALQDAGAELVLSGHAHNYERFRPQTAAGTADPIRGVRGFVVGTGGRSLGGFGTILPNSEVRNASTYGVLRLTLRPNNYDWSFVPQVGRTFTDRGTASCH
jgi:hypothetical protein